MSNSQPSATAGGRRKRTREAPPVSLDDDTAAALVEHAVDAQFASYKRSEVAARHPQWSAQRVTTEIRRQWKNMTPTEQQPWVELSNFDTQNVPQEPVAPSATPTARTSQAARELAPTKRAKARDEPRQPDTPYICFWKFARPEVVAMYPTLSAPNVSREVGARWRELPEEERQEWKDLAALDRHRYEKEMAAYRKSKAQTAKVSSPVTTSLAAAPPTEDKAPKPPKTGFQCFLSHNRESLALLNMTLDEFRDEMNELWQRMDHDDKQVWLDLAAQDRRRYETETAALKRPERVEVVTTKRLDELKAKAKGMTGAPQLPQTAFRFFSAAKRHELMQQKPNSKVSEVNREVGKLWKALDAFEKVPFISQAQGDVERFVRSMEEILTDEGDAGNAWGADVIIGSTAVPASGTTEVAIVAPNGRWRRKAKAATPRKPMNAFNMMYLAKREELMATYQLTQNECSALCGRMWRQMAEAERKQYHEMAKQDKLRYAQEMRQLTSGREASHTQTTHTQASRPAAVNAPALQGYPLLLESADDDHASFDELRRLEQSARAVFESSLLEDNEDGSRSRSMTPGFLYFVQSKGSKHGHEQWTSSAWQREWASISEHHRVLWEELAAAKPHSVSS